MTSGVPSSFTLTKFHGTTLTFSAFEVVLTSMSFCCFRCETHPAICISTCALAPRGLHHHWLPSRPGSLNQIGMVVVIWPNIHDPKQVIAVMRYEYSIMNFATKTNISIVTSSYILIYEKQHALESPWLDANPARKGPWQTCKYSSLNRRSIRASATSATSQSIWVLKVQSAKLCKVVHQHLDVS